MYIQLESQKLDEFKTRMTYLRPLTIEKLSFLDDLALQEFKQRRKTFQEGWQPSREPVHKELSTLHKSDNAQSINKVLKSILQYEKKIQSIQEKYFQIVHKSWVAEFVLWEYSENLYKQMKSDFIQVRKEIKNLSEAFEIQVTDISQEIPVGNKVRMADCWLQVINCMLNSLENEGKDETLMADKLSRYRQIIKTSTREMSFESLILFIDQLRKIYLDCSWHFIKTWDKQLRFKLLEIKTAGRVNYLVRMLSECLRELYPVDLQGNLLREEHIDIKRWSHKDLLQLADKLSQINEILKKNTLQDLKKLKHIHSDILPDLLSQLEALIMQTRLRVLNAQIRVNLAVLISETLVNCGNKLIKVGINEQYEVQLTLLRQEGETRRFCICSANDQCLQNKLEQILPANDNHNSQLTFYDAEYAALQETMAEYGLIISGASL
ncbi:MAG: hypothetical protein JEZ06_06380 [Anaerolineaceae bacterium]|nr:hypothetical protein [Anaerolineaceae bacterium]